MASASESRPHLVRDLNLAHALAINAGTMIGTGIFIVPQSIAASVETAGMILTVWMVASILAMLGAFTYAELGAAIPKAGGDYVYIRDAFGRRWGFLFGWTQLLVARSGSIAALAAGVAIQLGEFLPMGEWGGKLAALAAIALLTAINITGVRSGGNVQVLFTILKIGALLALITLAFTSDAGSASNFSPLFSPGLELGFIGLFGLALVDALWAYDGWNDVNLTAGEIKNPKRNVPRAMLGSIGLVMLVYILANLAYLYVLPAPAQAAFRKGRRGRGARGPGRFRSALHQPRDPPLDVRGAQRIHPQRCAHLLRHGGRRALLPEVCFGPSAIFYARGRAHRAGSLGRRADWIRRLSPAHDLRGLRFLVVLLALLSRPHSFEAHPAGSRAAVPQLGLPLLADSVRHRGNRHHPQHALGLAPRVFHRPRHHRPRHSGLLDLGIPAEGEVIVAKKEPADSAHKPFVPESMEMTEFTYRAVLLGLVMTVILGAANAYSGLRAGVTIAATYPAAVISMAVLRLLKGSVLEENLARTAGSIGESVAAGAVFTIPAFVIAGAWPSFTPGDAYWKSTSLMVLGSFLGVLFISLVRRVMVEDRELPYPESVAASEIHKAGQRGAKAAKYLFYNMALGAGIFLAGAFRLFAPDRDFFVRMGEIGRSTVRFGGQDAAQSVGTGGVTVFAAPSISPAYLGVGYIIGPRLAALNFAGGVLAWGLLVPLLMFFLGPQLQAYLPADADTDSWQALANSVWRFIVRPIAVGGMLVGAAYTLFRMRKNLTGGLKRAVDEIKGAAAPSQVGRLDRYMSSKVVFMLIGVVWLLMSILYVYLSGSVIGGIVAAVVMLLVGFFFATVSGYLVGIIGSSNNPVSGLTLSTLIIAARADGVPRSLRIERRPRRPGSRGGGLRLVRRRGRASSGLQGGVPPRRHSADHPDRGARRGHGARASSCTFRSSCSIRGTSTRAASDSATRGSPRRRRGSWPLSPRESSGATWPGRSWVSASSWAWS